ncbi:DUF5020 family protein [Dysgonomonas sp. Marseille-P4361]|uniref:DUF5020 family protein n=1 Tax=Dysgonomonas sp. Marseille-P4361 TaxID=2161820 RepID=UPI000D55401C|nr:DUF5020 family protein [Dysgonomonas sp. Marseille-P4361]
MKKVLVTLALLVLSCVGFAQNIQLHFDPRHALHGDKISEKNYFTATFEMFKPDKWGSTFMFVDLDFNQSRGNIGTAYLEIARDLKLGKSPIMAHVEFNGGLASWGKIPNAYLAGASYATNLGGVNLSTYVAYKYHAFARVSNDVQWTVTWGVNLLNDKLTLSGFLDLWTENKDRSHATSSNDKKVVLLTEPQIWYNVTPNLSLGSEIEISNNFLPYNKTVVNPTLAAKWNF